jgi:hypothetical protein
VITIIIYFKEEMNMKRMGKKLVAGTLCATMVLGSTMAVFAGDPDESESTAANSLTGTGAVEGTVSEDVFSVELPTVAADATTFNFILDPEGLIAKSGNNGKTSYQGKTFEDNATLFFANTATGAAKNYSSTSDALTATNKGTKTANVTITATLKNLGDIKVSDNSAFTVTTGEGDEAETKNSTDASIYLAIKDSATSPNVAAVDPKTNVATLTGTLAGADKSKFMVKYNATDSKYEFVFDSDTNADYTFPTYSFQLTGAANSKGDWSELTDAAPTVEVTWKFEDPDTEVVTKVAVGNWTGGKLWLGPDAEDAAGFTADTVKVEASLDGKTYATVANTTYTKGAWVATTWNDIATAVGTTNFTKYYVKVTDGTDVYVYTCDPDATK